MAGRIPQHFIDELLARTDIIEVIGAHITLKKAGREYSACCPFHNEKTPSFTVSADKQFFHCFGCGAHGTALGFLMDYERLEFVEAIEALAQMAGLEIPREGGAAPATDRNTPLYEAQTAANTFYQQALRRHPPAIDYLKARGLSGRTAADYGLGYAPAGFNALLSHLRDQIGQETLLAAGLISRNDSGRAYDRFRDRIIFPIRDRRGRVIGFGGRMLDDQTPKYLNSPETPLFHKGSTLYGLFEARKSGAGLERMLIVEGYMDVLALAEQGMRNAVATLGTATTSDHLRQLYRLSRELIFCFDGDRAGRQAAWRAVEQLLPLFQDGYEARFLFLDESEDPDSLIRRLGAREFRQRVEQATPLSEYFFSHLGESTDIDIASAAGRARLAEQARPLLEQLPDGVFRELMFKQMADRLGLRVERLRAGATGPPRPPPTRGDRSQTPYSLVRRALTLLLHTPELQREASEAESLRALDLPGVELLADILATLAASPELSAGALLERYRGTAHGPPLFRLMAFDSPGGDAATQRREFSDILAKLRRKLADQTYERLQEKALREGLTEPERAEYRRLLEP